jgi:hypothetical protein
MSARVLLIVARMRVAGEFSKEGVVAPCALKRCHCASGLLLDVTLDFEANWVWEQEFDAGSLCRRDQCIKLRRFEVERLPVKNTGVDEDGGPGGHGG